MDANIFKKFLDEVSLWTLSIHNQYNGGVKVLKKTSLSRREKEASKEVERIIKIAKSPIRPIEDELEEDVIDDTSENERRHKETKYPVITSLKPVKSTCELCKNTVISQIISYKLVEGSCTRKCSVCKKTDVIKTKNKF